MNHFLEDQYLKNVSNIRLFFDYVYYKAGRLSEPLVKENIFWTYTEYTGSYTITNYLHLL